VIPAAVRASGSDHPNHVQLAAMPTPPDAHPRAGLQFSLLSLLTLITLSAGLLALVQTLALPPAVKLVFAGGAILLAAYVLLRGVALCRYAFRLRRGLAQRRRELEVWVAEKRDETAAQPPSCLESSGQHPPAANRS